LIIAGASYKRAETTPDKRILSDSF